MTLKQLETKVADLQSSARANSSQLSTLIHQQQSTVQDLSAIRSSMERLEKWLSHLNQNHTDNVSEEVHVEELTLKSAQNSDLSDSKMEEKLTIAIELEESEVLDNTKEVLVLNLVPKLPFSKEDIKGMNGYRQDDDSCFCWEPGPNSSYQIEIISDSVHQEIIIDDVDNVYEGVVVDNSLETSSISTDSHLSHLRERCKEISVGNHILGVNSYKVLAVQIEEDSCEYQIGDDSLGNSIVDELIVEGFLSDNVRQKVNMSRSLMSAQKEFLNFKFKNDNGAAQVVEIYAQKWYSWEIYHTQLPCQMRNKHWHFLNDRVIEYGFSNRDYCSESNFCYVTDSYLLYNVVGSTKQLYVADGDPGIIVGGNCLRKTTMSKGGVTTITNRSAVSVSWNVQLSPGVVSINAGVNKATTANIFLLWLLPAPIITTTHLNSLLIMATRSKLLQNIMCNFPRVCSSQSAGFVWIISWGTTVIILVMILARESRKFIILHKSLVCWTIEQLLWDIPILHRPTCHTLSLIVDETYDEDRLSRKPKFAVTDIKLTTQIFLFYAAHHLHNDDRGVPTQSAETGSSGYVHSVEDIDLILCASSATTVAAQISWFGIYGTHFRFFLWGLPCLAMLLMPACTVGSVLLACYGVTRPTKETNKKHVQEVKDQLDLLDVFALDDHHISKTVKWIVLRVLAQNQNGGSALLETLVKMILCFDPGIARYVSGQIHNPELQAVFVGHPMIQKMLAAFSHVSRGCCIYTQFIWCSTGSSIYFHVAALSNSSLNSTGCQWSCLDRFLIYDIMVIMVVLIGFSRGILEICEPFVLKMGYVLPLTFLVSKNSGITHMNIWHYDLGILLHMTLPVSAHHALSTWFWDRYFVMLASEFSAVVSSVGKDEHLTSKRHIVVQHQGCAREQVSFSTAFRVTQPHPQGAAICICCCQQIQYPREEYKFPIKHIDGDNVFTALSVSFILQLSTGGPSLILHIKSCCFDPGIICISKGTSGGCQLSHIGVTVLTTTAKLMESSIAVAPYRQHETVQQRVSSHNDILQVLCDICSTLNVHLAIKYLHSLFAAPTLLKIAWVTLTSIFTADKIFQWYWGTIHVDCEILQDLKQVVYGMRSIEVSRPTYSTYADLSSLTTDTLVAVPGVL